MSDSDSRYRVDIRIPNATPGQLSVYDELRRDYRLHSVGITNSEARGNASYPDPFSPARKAEWITDLREELVDGMVYARAQLMLLAQTRRTDAKARHAWLTVSDVERRLSRALADLSDLDTDWSGDGDGE